MHYKTYTKFITPIPVTLFSSSSSRFVKMKLLKRQMEKKIISEIYLSENCSELLLAGPYCWVMEVPYCWVMEGPYCWVMEGPYCWVMEVPYCWVMEVPYCWV
jgi:hypothetical protein